MANKRVKIPQKTELAVMTKSKGFCYCQEKGNQIHHIDGDNSNNGLDNLAFLCFTHHDEAEIFLALKLSPKKSLSKGLSPALVKKRRDELYALNEKKNDLALDHYGKTLKTVTEENLFRASFEAVIIVDILKIQNEYFSQSDWKKKEEILDKLDVFSSHSSIRIANEVFSFCNRISYFTRNKMPVGISDTIQNIITNYFPFSFSKDQKKIIVEMTKKCSDTASSIIYDAFIYLDNLAVATSGLEILKNLYTRGKEMKIKEIETLILKEYSQLEHHLNRPERNDLENAKKLLKIYKEDLNNVKGGYPIDPDDDLYSLVNDHHTK